MKLSRSGLGAGHETDRLVSVRRTYGGGQDRARKATCNRVLGVSFLRFDMSEYMEKHTVSRLIGAPPGYVGFDQGGLLTDAVVKTPHAVLVMDEIEKAHPEVFDLLLQVMDHATLTDNNGKKADFRNIIVIMTTNAGAREIASEEIGFRTGGTVRGQNDPAAAATKARSAIERTFSPEFRNRLDAWIQFNTLAMSGRGAGGATSSSTNCVPSSQTSGSVSNSRMRRADGWRRKVSIAFTAPGRWRG